MAVPESPNRATGMLRRKPFLIGMAIAAAVAISSCLAFGFNLLHGPQLRSGDFFFRAAGYGSERRVSSRQGLRWKLCR